MITLLYILVDGRKLYDIIKINKDRYDILIKSIRYEF